MARIAAADGIVVMAATPHVSARSSQLDIGRLTCDLQAILDREGIALRLVPGAEVAATSDVVPLLVAGRLPTINRTRYVLLELGGDVAPLLLNRHFFELQMAGFVPILAHVERFRFTQSTPDLLADWCEHGVILQITAGSLRGEYGRSAQRLAEAVVKSELPAIVASDAHGPVNRRPELAFVRELVMKRAGKPRAQLLLITGPQAILDNRVFPTASEIDIHHNEFDLCKPPADRSWHTRIAERCARTFGY